MTATQREAIPGDSDFESKRRQDSPPPSPKPTKLLRTAGEGPDEKPLLEAEEQNLCKAAESSKMGQNARIQRYLVAIEYIGTRFSGSQQQPNCRTVVGVLQVSFTFSLSSIPLLVFTLSGLKPSRRRFRSSWGIQCSFVAPAVQ